MRSGRPVTGVVVMRGSFHAPQAVLLVDQRRDEFDDPLLTCCGGVQFAAHLSEPAINLIEPAINLLEAPIDVATQIDEVLSKSGETRRRGVSKIADLGSDLRDVAVGRTGEQPGRRGVLFGCLEPPLDITEIILIHGQSLPPCLRQMMRLAVVLWTMAGRIRNQHDWAATVVDVRAGSPGGSDR